MIAVTHAAIIEGSNPVCCWHPDRENSERIKMHVYARGLVLHTEIAVYTLREPRRDKNTFNTVLHKGSSKVKHYLWKYYLIIKTHAAIVEGLNPVCCWHPEIENSERIKMNVNAGGLVLHTENAVYTLREHGRDRYTSITLLHKGFTRSLQHSWKY